MLGEELFSHINRFSTKAGESLLLIISPLMPKTKRYCFMPRLAEETIVISRSRNKPSKFIWRIR